MSDKPWKLVTLHHEEILLTQEEYDEYVEKMDKFEVAKIGKDKFLNTKFISLVPNPDYKPDIIEYKGADEKVYKVTRAQLAKAIKKQEEYFNKKRDKGLFEE